MKITTLILLATTLLASINYAKASTIESQDGQDLSEMRNTDDLNIYDSVEALLHPAKKAQISNSKNQFRVRVDINLDGIDDGPMVEPFLGLPMRYTTIPHPQAENQTAVATMHGRMPIVLWGPQAASMRSRNFMGFAMQHEYAHHDLGHLMDYSIPSAVKEAQADCEATHSIIRYGMGFIIPEIINIFAAESCNYDPRTPLSQVQASHPCGTQRAINIRNCAGM